ncbi:N/A [soil metagenome]
MTLHKLILTALGAVLLVLPLNPALAENSAFRCSHLESDAALPTLEGKNGFFFRVMADLRMQHPMTEETVRRVADLAEALKEGGTTLIYVPVPTKSQTIPAMLPANAALYGFDTKVARAIYDDQIKLLNAHGVVAVDLLKAIETDDPDKAPFFKTDFHWTSSGARLAAEAIAEIVKAQDGYKELTPLTFETADMGSATAFSVMRRVIQRYCKDSVPRAETTVYQTKQVEKQGDAVDIFGTGDAGTDIALVGTSFSDAEYQNFSGFISEYSGLNVSNQSVTGGNQFGSLTSYLTSATFQQRRPKFLIWENPIYNNLGQFGDAVMAELITVASGRCKAVEASSITRENNTLKVNVDGRPLRIDDVIYAYSGNDRSRRIELELHRSNGKTLRESIERNVRVQSSGRFYLSLEPMWSDDIKSVDLKFDQLTADSAEVAICGSRGE